MTGVDERSTSLSPKYGGFVTNCHMVRRHLLLASLPKDRCPSTCALLFDQALGLLGVQAFKKMKGARRGAWFRTLPRTEAANRAPYYLLPFSLSTVPPRTPHHRPITKKSKGARQYKN